MRFKTFDQDKALDAAMHQFWESGYEGSSMQKLVERMGISRQSLYDTYGNKRDLFEAALARYRSDVVDVVIERILDPSLSPLDSIRAYLRAIVDGSYDTPSGCLMVRTASEIPGDDDVGRIVAECLGELRSALADRIGEGQRQGVFDQSRPAAELAAGLLACGMGLQVMSRLPGRGERIRPDIDALMAGIAVGSAPGGHA